MRAVSEEFPNSIRFEKTHLGESRFVVHSIWREVPFGNSFSGEKTRKLIYNTSEIKLNVLVTKTFRLALVFYLFLCVFIHKNRFLEKCNPKPYLNSLVLEKSRATSGSSTFDCSACKKTFKYASSLKAHARTHAGEMNRQYILLNIISKTWNVYTIQWLPYGNWTTLFAGKSKGNSLFKELETESENDDEVESYSS